MFNKIRNGIDIIRIKLFEEPFFKWYDKKSRFVKLVSYFS